MVAAGECWNGRAYSAATVMARPRRRCGRRSRDGKDMVFDIDWQGHRKLRAALPEDVVGVFILPPTLAALESRLRRRSGDDTAEIARRMALACDEISHWPEFDHVVVNDDLDRAVAAVRAVLHAARVATPRQIGLMDFVKQF